MQGSTVKPKLDHYVGRPVEKVISWGDEEWQWAIRLEGGVLFKNHDEDKVDVPNDVSGLILGNCIFSELDTRCVFSPSGEEVIFTPTLYTIADPNYTGHTEVFPQVPDEEEQIITPPDPSGDRITDGPSEEFRELQQQQAEEHEASLTGAHDVAQPTEEITEMGDVSDDEA